MDSGSGLGDLASGASGFSGIGNSLGGGVPDFGGGSGVPFGGDPQLTGDSGFPGSGSGFPGDTGGFPGGFPGGGSNFASTPAGNVGTQNDPALVAPAAMNQGSQSGPAAGATSPGAGVQSGQGARRAPASPPKPPQQASGGSHLESELQQIANMLLGRPPEQEAGTGAPQPTRLAQASTGTMTDASTIMMPPGADQSAPNVQTEPFGGEWSGAPPTEPQVPQVPQSPEGGFAGPGGPLPQDMPPPLPQPRPAEAPTDFPPLPQERPAEAPAAIEPKPPAETTAPAAGAAPGATGPTGGGQQPQFNPFRAIADFITNPMGSLMGLLGQLGGQGGFYPGIPNAPASWGTPPTGPQDPRWGKGPGTPGGVGPATAPVSPQSGPASGKNKDPNEAGISPEERQRRIRARDLGQPGTYVQDKNGKMIRAQTNPDGSPKFDAEGNPVPAPAETGGAEGGDPGNFIGQRGGSSTLGGRSQNNTNGLNPQLAQRLSAAGQAYERETGQRAEYGEGYRDRATQQIYWNRLQGGRLGPVARPGHSLHQQGLAMDMPERSGFTRWLQQGNAQRFGLGFPVRNDSNHIQMQDIRGRAYPYTPPSEASFGTPQQGGAGTAAAMSANPQERATATHPALVQARQPFATQLQNPNTARLLAANVTAEVGGQGPLAEQAYMETVFNRAASRRQTLEQAMTDRGYYPARTLRLNSSQVSPATQQRIMGLAQRVSAGSNLANFGTGNASGGVGFAGGPMTYNPGTGERFGIESHDRAWVQRVRAGGGQAAPSAAPYRDVGSSTRAEATPNTQTAANEQFANPPGRTIPPNMIPNLDPTLPDRTEGANPQGEKGLVYPPGWPIDDRTGAGRNVVVSSATPLTQLAMRSDVMSDAPLPGNAVSPFAQRFEGDRSDPNVPEYDPANTSMPMGRGFLPDPTQRQFSGQKVRVASTTNLPEIKVTPPPKEAKEDKEPGKLYNRADKKPKTKPKNKPKGMDPGLKRRIQARQQRRQPPPPYEPQLHRSGAGPYYWE